MTPSLHDIARSLGISDQELPPGIHLNTKKKVEVNTLDLQSASIPKSTPLILVESGIAHHTVQDQKGRQFLIANQKDAYKNLNPR